MCYSKIMKRKAATGQVTRTNTKKKRKTRTEDQIRMARALLNNADVKTHYFNQSAIGVTLAVPNFITLTDSTVLVPGVSQFNNYVGSRIKPINVTVRFSLVAGDATNFMRIGIFQLTGSASGVTASNFFYNTTHWNTMLTPYPTNPFNTLHDSMHTLVIGSDTQVKLFKVYIPASKLLPVTFNPSGTSITSGAIYCCVLSDSAAAPNPTVGTNLSIKYLDV